MKYLILRISTIKYSHCFFSCKLSKYGTGRRVYNGYDSQEWNKVQFKFQKGFNRYHCFGSSNINFFKKAPLYPWRKSLYRI